MKKIIASLLLINLTAFSCAAITLDEMTSPKTRASRVGAGNTPEQAFKVVESKKDVPTKDSSFNPGDAVRDLTYADLSLKKIAKEVADELELDSGDTLLDIKLLWIGAAQHSETVKFIIYKLSNPDEDKPNPSVVKKIIKPLTTVGSLAGMGVGSPVGAVTALMGSTMVGNFAVDEKELNYRFSKVNDADMVVLIRKIEELQRKICNYYFDYMSARASLMKTDEIVNKRAALFNSFEGKPKEQVIMADAYYREALIMQDRAKADFLSKRAALEQTVGMETMAEFEDILSKRNK